MTSSINSRLRHLAVLQWVRPFGLLSSVVRLDIRIGQGPWGTGLGLIVQPVHATYPKPLSPCADRHVRAAQFRRDRHVRFATRAPQDDPRPQNSALDDVALRWATLGAVQLQNAQWLTRNGAIHDSLRLSVVMDRVVKNGPVVPDEHVAPGPAMPVHEVRAGAMLQ